MTAIALGAHVLDMLAYPVTALPEGQSGTLVDRIRLAPAGTAAGTAVNLAKLGARVQSVGAVGTDTLGDVLVELLVGYGVDCEYVVRRDEFQTSASVLPIRPTGERPALHVIGANAGLSLDDVPWRAVQAADFLHLGAPEFLGPETATEILKFCRKHGVITAVDFLADGWPELLQWLASAIEHVDYVLPNRDQVCALTARDDLVEAARALLDYGPGCVAATCGSQGSYVITAGEVTHVEAFGLDAVDTSGCGDAYTAGFLRGLSLGHGPVQAAGLATACAAFVAEGLGSDAGEFDLQSALDRAGTASIDLSA